MAKIPGILHELRAPAIAMFFAIVQAIALAVFAYYLKDRVDAELKERAQIVSSIKEMQNVLDALKDPAQTNDRAENIVRLAMFGEDAVPVLVNLASANTKYDPGDLIGALKLLIVGHEESVCRSLRDVLAHRSLFDSQRMTRIEKFKNDNNCVDEGKTSLRSIVGGEKSR